MRLIKQIIGQLFVVLGLGLLASAASASVSNPENGKEFTVLERPQPTESGKKIEVIEFFAYYCPHCYVLEPVLAEWVKKQGDNIVFKRVHVSDPRVIPHQKLFYTLEAMGKTEELHLKIFNAFHVERNRLQTDADVIEFVTKSGIDKQKFLDVYNSFAVQSKLNRSAQLMTAYQIDSWPKIAIDGRFMTSPVMAGVSLGRVTEQVQNQAMPTVLDALIAKVQKEKNAPAAAEAVKAPVKKK